MSDRIFAGIGVLLCLSGLRVAWQIHSEYNYEPVGPRPFPVGILALMLFCTLALLLRKPDALQWPPRRVLLRLLMMVLALLLYAWGFEWLGFPLATALLTACISRLFGATRPAAVLSAVGLGGGLWYAFERLLDVTLPLGVWLH